MEDEKFVFEGLVEELQKVERVKDGGKTEKYKAKIQNRGDESDQVIKIESSEPIGLVEGEVVSISARQLQKSLDEYNGPKVNTDN